MVEHLLCKQGVIGSNPIVSITVVGFQSPVVRLVRGWRGLHGMVPRSACLWLPPRAWGGAVCRVCRWVSARRCLFFCVVNLVLVRFWARRTTRLWFGWRGGVGLDRGRAGPS